MSQESVEVFLQEASEQLQFLREYSGILQDPYPVQDDLQRLYIAAHTLEGSSGLYGFPLFREVTSALRHIFEYALKSNIAPDTASPLVEFISEAVALLESDLLMVSATGAENAEEIESFKQTYTFAFRAASETDSGKEPHQADTANAEQTSQVAAPAPISVAGSTDAAQNPIEDEPCNLEADADVPAEILEFFVPEAEEHLVAAQQCLL
ncbi:MAG: Hpt domain-containing protein, partial [Terriglobales bacterium]